MAGTQSYAAWLCTALLLTTSLTGCDRPHPHKARQDAELSAVQADRDAESRAYVPDSAIGHYLAARLAVGNNDLAQANEFFARAVKDTADAAYVTERALPSAIGAGDFAGALALAKQVDRSKNTATAQLASTVLLTDAFKRHDSVAIAKFAAELREEGFGKLIKPLAQAWGLVQAEQYADAQKQLDRLLLQYPSIKPFVNTHKALAASVQGRDKDADNFYRQMLQQDPSLRSVWLAGHFYESRDQAAQAEDVYRAVIDKMPDSTLPRLALRRLARQHSVKADNITTARQGMAAAFYDVASVLQQEGSARLSILYIQLANELSPGDDFTQLLLGNVLYNMDQDAQAQQIIGKISADSDLFALAQFRLAEIADATGDNAHAVRILTAMTDSAITRRQALTQLGDLSRKAEKYPEAIAYYSQIIDGIAQPAESDWPLFYARGVCYEQAGDWGKAETDLKQSLSLSPHQPEVLNYLAYSWADHGLQLPKALGMLQKALAGAPSDPYIIDSVGWALLKTGRHDDAVPYLEAAVQELPEDPTINDHLGDAYWLVGRRLEAGFQWERALKRAAASNKDFIGRVQDKLENGLSNTQLKKSPVLSNNE